MGGGKRPGMLKEVGIQVQFCDFCLSRMIHLYETSPNTIICDGQESNYALKEQESPARLEVLQDQSYHVQSRVLDSNRPSHGLVTDRTQVFLVASGRETIVWYCTLRERPGSTNRAHGAYVLSGGL